MLCLIDVRPLRFAPLRVNTEGEKQVLFMGAYKKVPKRKRTESEGDAWEESPRKKFKINDLTVMRVHPQYELLDNTGREEGRVFVDSNENGESSPSDYESSIGEDPLLSSVSWSEDLSQHEIGLGPDSSEGSPPPLMLISPPLSVSPTMENWLAHEDFNSAQYEFCKFIVFCLRKGFLAQSKKYIFYNFF